MMDFANNFLDISSPLPPPYLLALTFFSLRALLLEALDVNNPRVILLHLVSSGIIGYSYTMRKYTESSRRTPKNEPSLPYKIAVERDTRVK